MDKPRTLIFVGAHPDDESFNIGATLAQYAITGVKVYYLCATRGEEGQTNPDKIKGYSSISELRCAELNNAAEALGLTGVIHLNYRDSGILGWKDNTHPKALISAPIEQVSGRIVSIFRELKPDVVITFDPVGDYGHPDHIAIHKATVKAFYATGDKMQYLECGPPFQPQKLYFHVFPRRMLRIIVRVFSFFRIDMHRFGWKRKYDLASLVEVKYPVHAVVYLSKKAIKARDKAILCHASMLRDGTPHRGLNGLFDRLFGHRDYFMRAYPRTNSPLREHDLFEGI